MENFSPVNTYPVFRPNQVLTHKNLNDAVDYLEQQERLTRICTIGTGILCGLEPHWVSNSGQLVITRGVGITSFGFLIHLEETAFTHFELGGQNKDQLIEIPVGKAIVKGKKLSTGGANPLLQEELQDSVVLLVLECREEDNELCINDCDASGAFQVFEKHFYLVSPEEAAAAIGQLYQKDIDALDDFFQGAYGTKKIYIERFGYATETDDAGEIITHTNLSGIIKYTDFVKLYRDIIAQMVGRINANLGLLNNLLTSVNIPSGAFGALAGLVLPDRNFDDLEIQYIYDNLCDIADTYNELIDELSRFMASCRPNTAEFPKHLFLGQVFVPSFIPSPYRTPYLQPPVYNGNRARLQVVKMLYIKLQWLIDHYRSPLTGPLKGLNVALTPSKDFNHPLSQRSIPYYYDPNIYSFWNPELTLRGLSRQQYANPRLAEAGGAPNPPYDQPLLFSFLGHDFIRIEGHIGQTYDSVSVQLDGLINNYNLPFQTIALKIGDAFNDNIFQFDCEHFVEEKEQIEKLYAKCRKDALREVNQFTSISAEAGKILNSIDGPEKEELQKIQAEYNRILIEDLAKFEEPAHALTKMNEEFKRFFSKLTNNIPGENLLEESSIKELEELKREYNKVEKEIQEIKDLHLFHNFVSKYTGLEHKGGVPVGGTFILVYIGDDAKPDSRIVVGDFFLPYSCCSDCPPVCYLVDRVITSATVSPSIFCEDAEGESETYEITLSASPPGGFLSGPGLERIGGKYFFTPSRAEFVNLETGEIQTGATNGTARLKYSVDGVTAYVIIDVIPRPNAEFFILALGGETPIDEICQEQNNTVVLEPGEGIYSILEQPDLVIDDFRFNPDDVIIPEGDFETEITIQHTMNNSDAALCPGVSTKPLIVKVTPNPSFDIIRNGQIIDFVCENQTGVTLVPVIPGGTFTAKLSDGTPVKTAIDQDANTFNPSAFSELLEETDSIEVNIRYELTVGCGNDLTKSFEVRKAEQVTLERDPSKEQYCSIESVAILTKPDTQLSITTSTGQTLSPSADNVLDLSSIDFSQSSGQEPVEVVIVGTAGPDSCLEGTARMTFQVVEQTIVSIEVEPQKPLYCSDENVVISSSEEVDLVIQTDDGQNLELDDNGTLSLGNIEFPTGQETVTVNITLADSAADLCLALPDPPVSITVQQQRVVIPVITNEPQNEEIWCSNEIIEMDVPEGMSAVATIREGETLPVENGQLDLSQIQFEDGQERISISIELLPSATQPCIEVGDPITVLVSNALNVVCSIAFDEETPDQFFLNISVPDASDPAIELNPPAELVELPTGEHRATYNVNDVPLGSTINISISAQTDPCGEASVKKMIVVAPPTEEIDVGNSGLLADRVSNYNTQVNDLKSDVSKNRFNKTKDFIELDKDEEDLDEQFLKLGRMILASLKRSQGEKRNAYTRLLGIATQSYLDKLVFRSPDKLDKEANTGLKELVKEVDDPSVLIEGWNPGPLRKIAKAKVIKGYKDTF